MPMQITHAPKYTNEGYTMESWYCDGEATLHRDYDMCKKTLIDLLEKKGVDLFNILQIKEHVEEIYIWHVASVEHVSKDKPGTSVHYFYVSIITESDDVLCHFRIYPLD